jgi:glycine cleavage system P protein (glycine dehydrogenase) subunit 1
LAYGPHTPADRQQMLTALGMQSVDELFADIPERLRSSPLRLDPPEPEQLLMHRLAGLAAKNKVELASFLGAGAYRHFSPPMVDQILLRGEWYTAYTPYQPEVSQGTLQSIYEYESLIAELVGLDVVSASHYDGAAATAEAALMTCRATGRSRVLVSRSVHPQYRAVLETYFDGAGLELEEIPVAADGPDAGITDLAMLDARLADADRPVAGLVAAQPSFYGLLEPMAVLSEKAHAAGALFVAVVEPVSLSVLAPPGAYGADIAAGEGQALGIPPQYGGPYLGILACTDSLVRQIPGRLVGMTTDVDGKRAYVMTLQAREQHIRREKAASNICTNQTLLALAASLWLAALGPHGLRDVAAMGAAKAAELEAALASVGVARVHTGAYLNEFAVRVPNAAEIHRQLLDRGVLAGLVLSEAVPDEPGLADALLVCATEVTTGDDIATFAREIGTLVDAPVGAPA